VINGLTGKPAEDTAIEAKRYEQVWTFPVYRKSAPGSDAVDEFVSLTGPASVVDFGAGTGRPAAAIAEASGAAVTLVDFAGNCRDDRPDILALPFSMSCLWDLPGSIYAEWGFCTDVMEHIPPEYVDDVLANIAGAVERGCYFRISTTPDAMGRKLVGSPLHLTVQDHEWWHGKLMPYFDVDLSRRDGAWSTFLCLSGE
jgi:hypothetical protein